MPLNITIIGAGISGLTAAICLSRHQPAHRVTILEKSTFSSMEFSGSAQFLSPNGAAIFARLRDDFGLDIAGRAGGNPAEGILVLDGQTGHVHARQSYVELAKTYEFEWLLVHRGDLQRELRRVVEGLEGVELVLGAVIEEIDAESGRVRVKGGRTVESDVIIGADGVHSQARRTVVGEERARVKPYGKRCYRFLIKKEILEQDELTKEFVAETGTFVDIPYGAKKISLYPCRGNTMINGAAFLPDDAQTVAADWNQAANREVLQEGFKDFFPPARRLLELVGSDLRSWQLYDLDPLPTYTTGRLTLIGDAAHPFLPFLGQGGNQAIEDSGSIGLILDETVTREQVPAKLKLYEEIRKERAEYVQEETRRNGLPPGQRPPPNEIVALMDSCHRHDEWKNTQSKLTTASA